MDRNDVIGRNVRSAREAAGLTQTDLASRLGVRERTVINIEAGKVSITLRRAERIAEICGCTLDTLSSLNGKKTKASA